MKSKPYVFITQGWILPLKGIRYAAKHPVTFWGVDISNELYELGTTDETCYLDVTSITKPLICIWYEFTNFTVDLPIIKELVFNNRIAASCCGSG